MTTKQPVVGMGATKCYPSDLYPMVVVSVSPTRKVIGLKHLPERPNDEPPAYHAGPWPVFDHAVDPATKPMDDQVVLAYLHADGRYYIETHTPIGLGEARYRRDHSD